MEKGKTSRTAEAAAAQRAIHQLFDDEPKILVDPIAPKIVDVDGDPYKFAVAARDHPNMKLLRSNMVLRSRYTEDCLAEAVQRRVRQYLILGAGLDTFAYRQPPWGRSLHIFEVDHPLTQESKKERLAAAAISAPANLTFAPIDFQSVSLSDGLRACGFDLAATTFCAWLGVTVYLTEEAIDTTFEFIARLPRGTEIVFTYIPPLETLSGVDAEVMAFASQSGASVGEPWISFFLPAQLETRLRRNGFCEVIDLPPEEAQEKYFKGRRDGLGAPPSVRLMRAIV